ncbi:MAG: hypothetical protein B7Y05_03685 [Polynucleobacter sp. 24-46-87]|jgi:hypothetical protein|nr:MAG: hypothetical protein B7Y05_03685 [Polynucleobacter sp. 24-46-87]OZB49256.1 MAG: hypothetical protein B7X60_01765 [Polynucleobacter sp. 39-45-136]
MLNTVKLLDGSEISWDEFSRWSYQKQRAAILGTSEETRKRLREIKARTNCSHSAETIEKIRQSMLDRLAAGWRPASGEKISKKLKGRKFSTESLEKRKATRIARGLVGKGSYLARGIKPSMGAAKAVQTPFGLFISKTAAAEAMRKMGTLNPLHRLKEALISDPKNYYLVKKNNLD